MLFRSGLLQKLVDQRGFAVVDVRDNGDITEILNHRSTRGLRRKSRALYRIKDEIALLILYALAHLSRIP